MIKITIQNDTDDDLIDPVLMAKSNYGTVFRQYFKDIKQKDLYFSCGQDEDAIIHIWYDEENNEYRLSTDDIKSLKELVKSVKVKQIDATIEITLTAGE
jgi:hypothetical protein